MFAVVVTLTLKPGAERDFMPEMVANAAASRRDEPGCLRFDVCTDPDRPGDVFLYELYSDAAAFEAHMAMPHFIAFDAATASMIAAKAVTTYGEVGP